MEMGNDGERRNRMGEEEIGAKTFCFFLLE